MIRVILCALALTLFANTSSATYFSWGDWDGWNDWSWDRDWEWDWSRVGIGWEEEE